MTAAADLLRQYGINIALDRGPGEYPTTCPNCSPGRQKKNKKDLNVRLKEDGSVVWYCHHCVDFRGPEGSGAKKEIVPTHIYRDAEGIIRFGKVRNPPGAEIKCWFCHPDAGVWKKGLAKGTNTKIIYRADEVAEAIKADRTICVVEGEKDADNLWRLDIPATCNAHGASETGRRPKWDGDHAGQLKGANVVVFMDNDAAGYAHADAVRGSFVTTRRARWLDLKDHWPQIPKGGDVSDWLAVGGDHTPERLKELIASAPYHPCDRLPSDPDYVLPEREPEPPPQAEATADDVASSGAPPIDEDAELDRLAKLSLFEFDRARKAAAEKLGVRASILDKLVAAKRAELGLDGDDNKQGRPFDFAQVDSWPSAVDGKALLDEITKIIRKHVIMPPHAAEAIALWIVHTHVVERFLISPRLALRSVTKQCGKTTTLDILARLVHRPLPTVNVTAAAIFRVVEAHRPCLLVDEADTFLKDNEELRGIINSGHRQGGCVLRVEGDQHETRAFATFAPCAIAAIGSLPGTIMDRSVVIDLARRKPDEKIEAFRLDRGAALDEIARRIVRWAEDNADAIGALDPEMPAGLYNRASDNWRPLLQVADAAAGDWPQRARAAALSGAPDLDEVSRLELLLGDIRDIFEALNRHWISSAELIENLIEITPRPWSEFGRGGKPISQNKLARLLKPLGITPDRLEVGEDRARGYFRAHFDDAFARYLAPEGVSNRPPVREPYKSGTSPTSQSVREEKSRTDANMQETQHPSHRGHMDTLKGGNGQERPIGLSQQAIEALAERVRHYAADHIDDADLTASTERNLHRWVAETGVLPEHVATEAERVMTRVWRTY